MGFSSSIKSVHIKVKRFDTERLKFILDLVEIWSKVLEGHYEGRHNAGGRCSTIDNVLALHPTAPGSNLSRDICSLLLSLWTVLRWNPSSAKSKGFHKCSAAKASSHALQKGQQNAQKAMMV